MTDDESLSPNDKTAPFKPGVTDMRRPIHHALSLIGLGIRTHGVFEEARLCDGDDGDRPA